MVWQKWVDQVWGEPEDALAGGVCPDGGNRPDQALHGLGAQGGVRYRDGCVRPKGMQRLAPYGGGNCGGGHAQ